MSSKFSILSAGVLALGAMGCSGMFVPMDQYSRDVTQRNEYVKSLERDNAEWRSKGEAYDRMLAEKGLYAGARAEYAAIAEALKKALAGMEGIEPGDVTVGSEGQLIVGSDLLFDLGSWTISAKGKEVLKKIADMNRGTTLRIVGHTDKKPVSRPATMKALEWDNNLELSCKRALAVMGELSKNHISERSMWIEGRGSVEPRGNDKQSRRVEIWRVSGGGPANTSFQK